MEKETEAFIMPNPTKITDRKSSITNASVNGIIPSIEPDKEKNEIGEALKTLQMTSDKVCCAYCGKPATEWDHFFPLIEGGEPTGYITEIHNLVPCCSTCNSSKGNTYWRDWFYGNAKKSPKTRKEKNDIKGDLDSKYEKLDDYENNYARSVLCIEEIIGVDKWKEYKESINKIFEMMEEAQVLSEKIKEKLKNQYDILINSESDENDPTDYPLVDPPVDPLVDEDVSLMDTMKEAFKNKSLKFNGGWGYKSENSVKIESNKKIEIESLEYQFMDRRLSMEMKKYSLKVKEEKGMKLYGYRAKKKKAEEDEGNGKTYDKITMEVTIFLKDQEQVKRFKHEEEGWFYISSPSNK